MKKEEKQRRQRLQELNEQFQNEVHQRDTRQINCTRIHQLVAEINSVYPRKTPQIPKFEAWQHDKTLIELNRKLTSLNTENSNLICPQCGGSDRSNTMNGKPWCFKCQLALMPKGKIYPIIKSVSLKEELKKVSFINQ